MIIMKSRNETVVICLTKDLGDYLKAFISLIHAALQIQQFEVDKIDIDYRIGRRIVFGKALFIQARRILFKLSLAEKSGHNIVIVCSIIKPVYVYRSIKNIPVSSSWTSVQ